MTLTVILPLGLTSMPCASSSHFAVSLSPKLCWKPRLLISLRLGNSTRYVVFHRAVASRGPAPALTLSFHIVLFLIASARPCSCLNPLWHFPRGLKRFNRKYFPAASLRSQHQHQLHNFSMHPCVMVQMTHVFQGYYLRTDSTLPYLQTAHDIKGTSQAVT